MDSRRGFLVSASMVSAGVVMGGAGARIGSASARTGARGGLMGAQPVEDAAAAAPGLYAEFPSQEPRLVRDIVGASHGRIDRVRELLKDHPALAKAAWDWGFGDWESALGAASHVGNREIAQLLIDHGARPDLFTFAMLGNVDVVRAAIEASPAMARIHGPHGFTLAHHARVGGEGSAAVAAYLATVEGADVSEASQTLDASELPIYTGTYAIEGEGERKMLVSTRRGGLTLEVDDGPWRSLFRVGDHAFFPTGAAAVRVVFAVGARGGEEPVRASSLTIHDGPRVVIAVRAE